MIENFPVEVKSTLDKLLADLAEANNWLFFDLDGGYLLPQIMGSTEPAIVISFPGLTDSPRDPFYNVIFEVGARTSDDPSQYLTRKITGAIGKVIERNKAIQVYNYHEESPSSTDATGYLFPVNITPTPARFDQVSGLTMLQVHAEVFRYG